MLSPLAGLPAPRSILVDVLKLVSAYYSEVPDPEIPRERVIFGTSGHRGSSFDRAFNEWHILAITQAICLYRAEQKINGPLFMGIDTHALSVPAFASALEVLAGNGVEVMIAMNEKYTPTPVISHAILTYNQGRASGLADGIVVTPSHNPPRDGGFKYNPPNGGPADSKMTGWIQNKANELLMKKLQGVKRLPFEQALQASTTHRFDFMTHYIDDLGSVINMDIIRGAGVKMGVDPLGGAGVHYWKAIAEKYKLDLTVVSDIVDPTFSFMTVDWDGQIRMDPSSPFAMVRLIQLKDKFDIAFACDTDHDRHGIVTRSAGLLPPNHYLSVAIDYLFQHRPLWTAHAAAGKTIVSSQMIDRVIYKLERDLYEAPVGFKWFAQGLEDGTLGFAGEESAGASFSRLNGKVWTTDKDGIIMALLSGEITASTGKDVGDLYKSLENDLGKSFFNRIDAPASLEQKAKLSTMRPEQIKETLLAGEKIQSILTNAPGNGEPIGGIKVIASNSWFAARPSGTEEIYRLYAESFKGEDHLNQVILEAKNIINKLFTME